MLRDHTFLGTTKSLCPECLTVVDAKIVRRDGRVYFQKRCPTHGAREDFVCSDASRYDRHEYSVPGRLPARFGTEVARGCPLDCGICPDHEQHTCIGLVEVTDACNLRCPMCYSSSAPGRAHRSLAEIRRMIDRLVEVEGGAEILQISGGEPTVHPEIDAIVDYALSRDVDLVMLNTNGLRFASDPALAERLGRHDRRFELYFQLDGFRASTSIALRGEDLVERKLEALAVLGAHGVRVTLVCTLQPGVNLDEVGALVRFGAERPGVAGVSFQPATYSGRSAEPADLGLRVTYPDVVDAIASQTEGTFVADDFIPLPCAHPNCHTITYAYRAEGRVLPLTRLIDAREHVDLLANGIAFDRPRGRQLVQQFLRDSGCVDGACDALEGFLAGARAAAERSGEPGLAAGFFARALHEDLAPSDIFRIAITSFLDPYNFDVRRVMKCCIHHVLPSGHVVPFCAYNVLYREGHVELPPLADTLVSIRSRG